MMTTPRVNENVPMTTMTIPCVNNDNGDNNNTTMGDEGEVWAVVSSPSKGMLFSHYLSIFIDFILTSLTVNVTRRIPPRQPSPRGSPTHPRHRITPSLVDVFSMPYDTPST